MESKGQPLAIVIAAATWVALGGGCTEDGDGPDAIEDGRDRLAFSARGFGSGERLSAEVLDGGGGAVLFQAFYDVTLDARCDIERGADGVARCYPRGPKARFADARCTDAVHVTGPCEGPSKFARLPVVWSDDACLPDPAPISRVGAARPEVREVFYLSWDGSCTSGGAPPGTVHELSPVADEELVSAELVREDLGGGLGRDVWSTDDGAHVVLGSVDLERDLACRPDPSAHRCMPADEALVFPDSGLFGDGACEAPAASRPACALSRAPRIVRTFVPDGCSYATAFHEVGAEVEAPHVLRGGACEPAEGRFVGIGAPADLATYPRVEATKRGWGALVVESLGVDRKSATLETSFSGCTPVELDGELRCLPPHASVWHFADPSCTQPLGHAGDPCSAVDYFVVRASAGCGHTTELRQRIDRHVGPVYAKQAGSCVEVEVEGETFELGAPLPGDMFHRVTRRRE